MRTQIKNLIIKFQSKGDNIISKNNLPNEKSADDQIISKDNNPSKITKKK